MACRDGAYDLSSLLIINFIQENYTEIDQNEFVNTRKINEKLMKVMKLNVE